MNLVVFGELERRRLCGRRCISLDLLDGEKLDVDVSHGGVDDGAVRHSLGPLGLRGRHHFLL